MQDTRVFRISSIKILGSSTMEIVFNVESTMHPYTYVPVYYFLRSNMRILLVKVALIYFRHEIE